MASKGRAAPKKAAKKKNGYEMPKQLKLDDVVTDSMKVQWKIGNSIGIGGFGEIYSACKVGSTVKKVDDYPYVIKIEPKVNGPIHVEINFYIRNAKQAEFDKFKKARKLGSLGIPEYIASGTEMVEDTKHRFLVLPRFGRDIQKIFIEQKNKLPIHTVYRLGWQTLNGLEFIHSCGYVHGDIKGSNIMLGLGKSGEEQAYLLDYGLACKFNTKEYRVEPKKQHNGTIEYTSRDAHNGVSTIRGDIEILAYNLIEWAGVKLPWVEKNLLMKPAEVQKAKDAYFKSPEASLKSAFGSIPVPSHLSQFIKYLVSLNHDTVPDYSKIRTIFEAGIKECGKKNSGPLDFVSTGASQKPKEQIPRGRPDFSKLQKPGPSKKATGTKRDREEPEEVSDDDVVLTSKSPKKAPAKTSAKTKADVAPVSTRNRERKRYTEDSDSEEDNRPVNLSPRKKARASPPRSTSKENYGSHDENPSPPPKKAKGDKKKTKSSNEDDDEDNEVMTDKKTITLKSKSGKSSKNKKTIHLNLNLDVSLGSDLVLVVNRKDKKPSKKTGKDDDDEDGVRAGVYKGKHAKA